VKSDLRESTIFQETLYGLHVIRLVIRNSLFQVMPGTFIAPRESKCLDGSIDARLLVCILDQLLRSIDLRCALGKP